MNIIISIMKLQSWKSFDTEVQAQAISCLAAFNAVIKKIQIITLLRVVKRGKIFV